MMKVKLPRRTFLYQPAAVLPVLSRIALAQSYPARPVRFVHGFAAGGSGDIAARLIGQCLSDRLGQQFVVENRTGAGGNIAVEAVARAPADGYTLLQLNVANTINTALYERLNFNLLNDIAPVASFMRVPNVMEVTPSLPVKTVPEFIAYAKANPGKISFASSGVGSSIHMSGELFKAMAKIDMLHVPYRGIAAGGLSDLMTGVVHVAFDNLPSWIELIRTGKLRALAGGLLGTRCFEKLNGASYYATRCGCGRVASRRGGGKRVMWRMVLEPPAVLIPLTHSNMDRCKVQA
jgi:tripartite-type tricarboxylate transporter receptor subunit TctC